jgi:UDP-glucose 4-epimerase
MTFRSALISGASGFIGGALARALLNRGIRVGALARTNAIVPSGVTCFRTDNFAVPGLAAILKGQTFDLLYHLAAYGIKPGDRDPETMQAVNISATGALVELAAYLGTPAIVYAGSCSEYETGEDQSLIDEDRGFTTKGVYGASKVAGGFWGRALALEYGISFSWMRLFGVYGPGEASHRLIPEVVAKLRRDQMVELTPGYQQRDLMFIDDAVQGLILAGEAALDGHTGPYNLCIGHPIGIAEVARMVARQMGKPESLLGFGLRPYRPGEPMWMVGKPDRFCLLTGHRAVINLETGIARSIAAVPLK